jgi:hypothetical protein
MWLIVIAGALASATCLIAGGCSVTQKSASVDSVSRLPFFNIELAPRKRDAAPETQRIRLEGSIPLEPEPAKLIANKTSKGTSWWPRRKSSETPTSIALPRTDLTEAASRVEIIEGAPSTPAEPVEF